MSENRLRLKQATGWFAASSGFRAALELLGDGAFRLFVYLCLEADRRSGRVLTSYSELARGIRRSRRVLLSYVSELERKQVCIVRTGRNQHARTLIEVAEGYWPYIKQASGDDVDPQNPTSANVELIKYVEAVRRWYLDLGCTAGRFSERDRAKAQQFHRRGIALELIEAALLLGAGRKYLSWLNGGASTLIGTLEYFEPLVAELDQQPLSKTYTRYLRANSKQLAQMCRASGVGAGAFRTPQPTGALAPQGLGSSKKVAGAEQ
jgi:hypothetical protein